MENKQVISSGQMIKSFIGYFIGLTIIFSFIISGLYDLFVTVSDSEGISALINKASLFYLITTPLSIFLSFKIAFYCIFQKKTITKVDAQGFAISIILFFVVLFLIDSMYNYKSVHSTFDENISELDSYISIYGTQEDKAEYEKLKEEINSGLNKIVIINAAASFVSYALLVPYSKKLLSQYSVDDNYTAQELPPDAPIL